jgi:hypothetical protein
VNSFAKKKIANKKDPQSIKTKDTKIVATSKKGISLKTCIRPLRTSIAQLSLKHKARSTFWNFSSYLLVPTLKVLRLRFQTMDSLIH